MLLAPQTPKTVSNKCRSKKEKVTILTDARISCPSVEFVLDSTRTVILAEVSVTPRWALDLPTSDDLSKLLFLLQNLKFSLNLDE
jgi:hypothetical protein